MAIPEGEEIEMLGGVRGAVTKLAEFQEREAICSWH